MNNKLFFTLLFGAAFGLPAASPGQEDSSESLLIKSIFDFNMDDPALAEPQTKYHADDTENNPLDYLELDPTLPIEEPTSQMSRFQSRKRTPKRYW
ncbi:hypothetical protein DSO57_1025372 [Entomophthora muscae]|uniref:Uncharacterized protein n=1 Tax=Entomophthora muscae TaxID=34485 RepID=A0ACC2UM70_9FUNG|nr:hypothetical protein DSO57_1025372 [Entomophthora muscae]